MDLPVEEVFRQYFELATPQEIRAALRESAFFFIKKNCCYSDEETRAALDILAFINPINNDYEAFNKKNPNHGRKIFP